MEMLEQGSLELTGSECFGSIQELSIRQKFGFHGHLTATVWLRPKVECDKVKSQWEDLPIALIPAGREREPIFSGIIKYVCFMSIGGRQAIKIEAFSGTVQMDQKRKDCSFQQESRTCGELVSDILAPYRGAYIWNPAGRDEPVGRFLMQYQESDWEFLRRIASFHGHPVIPEVRFPGAKMFIGLPSGREEKILNTDSYKIKKRLDKTSMMLDNRTTGGLSKGLEIEIKSHEENHFLGDVIHFLGGRAIVAEKYSRLKNSQWVHDYVLRPASNCRMERMDNLNLMGAAVRGTVLGTSLTASKLSLDTDGAGGQPESWHTQPVYYAGGGKGYSGQPEKGDVLYLYFPTMKEEDRYIIGGADAGAERINAIVEKSSKETDSETAENEAGRAVEAVKGDGQAASMAAGQGASEQTAESKETMDTGTRANAVSGQGNGGNYGGAAPQAASPPKNWSTPGNQSLFLSEAGISLSNGEKSRISILSSGIRVRSPGDMKLETQEIIGKSKKISIDAKEYIWINCQDSGLLLLPDTVHMKAADIKIESPLNKAHEILKEENVSELLGMYEAAKKKVPPIIASDGSVIRPEGYDDILKSEELFNYFIENEYGKGEYENPINQPVYGFYSLWIEEMYGKTEMKKFWEHMETLDGFQDMLDVVGIVFEPADLLNGFIYACRGKKEEALLTFACAVPLIGDLAGKGGKKLMSAGADLSLKLGKNGKRVLESLEITYKAVAGKGNDLKKYLDDLFEYSFGGYSSENKLEYAFTKGYFEEGPRITFTVMDDVAEGGIKGGKAVNVNVNDFINKVPNGYKKFGKCDKYADYLEKLMKENGTKGERLFVESKSGIWSDRAKMNIAPNGKHHAIKIGDTVYDNMNPNGINYNEWLNDLGIPQMPTEIKLHDPIKIN